MTYSVGFSSPSGLGEILVGADACIANYVFRILLVSMPLVVLLSSFARFIQIEKDRNQRGELLAKDFGITVLFVFFAVMGVRLVFTTWEYFGIPVNCMFYSLGLYEPNSGSLSSMCHLGSSPDLTSFVPNLKPSMLGINVCHVPGSSSTSMPFTMYLSFALSTILTLTRLSFFAVPIFISAAVMLRPFLNIFNEVREKQENHHIAVLKVLTTGFLLVPAIAVITNYIYIALYIDYKALLEWAKNTIFKMQF